MYLVGKGTPIVAEQDGVLELGSNDFSLGENHGTLAAPCEERMTRRVRGGGHTSSRTAWNDGKRGTPPSLSSW